jgi:hypothetical protein
VTGVQTCALPILDMNSGFYSTDSIFHEWCLDYFSYMWRIAKPFNPNRLNEV